MNRVELVGRLTHEPEMKMSQSGNGIVRFGIAVKRTRKAEGQPEADFINCVAFSKTAEFIDKYIKKGYLVSVAGRIQTGSYENQQGTKVYTFDVLCDEVQNLTPKQTTNEEPAADVDLGLSSDDLPF